MLNGISAAISPDLIKVLMEMGHGDEIVIADGNFPAESIGQRIIRADGLGVPDILNAILELFPLDDYVDAPITLMAVCEGDKYQPVIWDEFKKIIMETKNKNKTIQKIERFDFYNQSKEAFAVVATSETSLYANIILKKGVVKI